MKKIKRSSIPRLFFSNKEKHAIVESIQQAEKMTSGEIRVHIAKKVNKNILQEALEVFNKIGMTKTRDRNGVLIYFSVKDRRFAVLGDEGIHKKMGNEFWDNIVQLMQVRFQENDFADGMEKGILSIGNALKTHFPCQPDDVNELPDNISY